MLSISESEDQYVIEGGGRQDEDEEREGGALARMVEEGNRSLHLYFPSVTEEKGILGLKQQLNLKRF